LCQSLDFRILWEDLTMHPGHDEIIHGTTQEPRLVSGRFLSDLFGVLERHRIPVVELLGDLPIPLDERGRVRGSIEWNDFTAFMRRLENRVGDAAGLEACGEMIGELAPAAAISSLAGYAASPYALYKAASQWALRRALPGVEVRLKRVDKGHLEIHARIADGLRPCPQIFHFATGGARKLPRLVGSGDAVVSASIGDREAHYRIALPPSRSLLARCKRLVRTIFSAGSVLHYLEAQQLELHAKNDALQRAHDALAESERRFRAIIETAVDVLCEIDEAGRVVYVSGSIQDLIGYSPEQVTGSHYRLWVSRNLHKRVDVAFDFLMALPTGRATQESVRLHTESGESVTVEMTTRSYDTPEGARRIVCIVRNLSDLPKTSATRRSALPAEISPLPVQCQPQEHEVSPPRARTLGL
jgi:PAS domain S-box-containing protein